MKLISTLYNSGGIQISIVVKPKAPKAGVVSTDNLDPPIVSRYQSKIGNVSLIYNPTVYITIKPGYTKNGSPPTEGLSIPGNLVYRLSGIMNTVYSLLSTAGMYTTANSCMYIDKPKQHKATRSLQSYKSLITVRPAVVQNYDSKPLRGVDILCDGILVVSITHMELLSVAEFLSRFDITTYGLLSAVVDEMESLHDKVDEIGRISERTHDMVEDLIKLQTVNRFDHRRANPADTSGLTWQTIQ